MLVLLPPSESKRAGGIEGSSLDLSGLSFQSLSPQRRSALAALRALSRNLGAATIGLGLGPSQRFEIDRNRVIGSSPTMPAVERYTGVLYDALDVETMDAAAREFLSRHVVIHSALFGLSRADDLLPAYRLSHDSRLPGLSLKRLWAEHITAALAEHTGLTIDLRSEAYLALGPTPLRDDSYFVRVVTESADGTTRALNHFNKKGKGEFVRALAIAGADHADLDSLLGWAESTGITLLPGSPGELQLVI